MEPYIITEFAEYEYLLGRGYDPLVDDRHFRLDIRLRIEIQKKIFGDGHTPADNEKFYRWMWRKKPHYCEECMRPLREYSATYISHILTRGAYPEMAHDPRNVNILCFEHHNAWEQATTRKDMRIYAANQLRIEKLKNEYGRER